MKRPGLPGGAGRGVAGCGTRGGGRVAWVAAVGVTALAMAAAEAVSPYQSSGDFARYAMKLRESALLKIEPQVQIPTTGGSYGGGRYPWKKSIVTTVFWIGESSGPNNPVANRKSSWDANWMANFGGFDDPNRRSGFLPVGFVPKQNPFYCALPYNDVTRGTTKPEARRVIPWFKRAFQKEGQSVCRDRWVEIRKGNRVCFAQWSDCGPFRTDHFQYVFGNARPMPNLNRGAGLDVSPAVRDYLGLRGIDVTDWRFVEVREVSSGPWAKWGENNDFVIAKRDAAVRVAEQKPAAGDGPKVMTR